MKKQTYPFDWLEDESQMVVDVEINGRTTVQFLLDTGSSHTCLDKNVLYIYPINLNGPIGQVELETANGWILADVYQVPSLKVFGLELENHPVQVIDFIEHRILSDYAGVLGMDILKRKNLCIHYEQGFLTFED